MTFETLLPSGSQSVLSSDMVRGCTRSSISRLLELANAVAQILPPSERSNSDFTGSPLRIATAASLTSNRKSRSELWLLNRVTESIALERSAYLARAPETATSALDIRPSLSFASQTGQSKPVLASKEQIGIINGKLACAQALSDIYLVVYPYQLGSDYLSAGNPSGLSFGRSRISGRLRRRRSTGLLFSQGTFQRRPW